MEQDKTGEYPTPKVPRCYSRSHAKLQGAHTPYKEEGGHPQQSTRKAVQFKMGSKHKYHKNNIIGIMLFCGCIRSTSLGEIISCPELIPELNSACRAVTGCLKPTNVEDMYLLAGIAPPDIRRDVCARVEKTKQETNETHSLYGQNTAERMLKSRNWFFRSVKPADFTPKVIRCSAWLKRLHAIPHRATANIDESLANGFDKPWTTWRCQNLSTSTQATTNHKSTHCNRMG